MKNHLKSKPALILWLIVAAVILLATVFCYLGRLPLVIPLLFLFLGVHIYFSQKASLKLFLSLGLLLTLAIFTAHAFVEYTKWPLDLIPVAAIAMLTVLLYNDLQLSFLMSLAASVSVGLIVGQELTLVFFISSLTAMYAVKEARTRGEVIRAGWFIGLVQIFTAVLLHYPFSDVFSREFVLNALRPMVLHGFVNGFVAVSIVISTSKVFEYLFGVLTNFSLLELSDFNQPLLKRMVLEAPGTYHHTLIVSNLSEAASDAIGANALLTRVGAYYHDIGKMVKPEYFTENQMISGNKHDHLEPAMSRLVILNHVKEGIELAKKYKLNPHIVDFIPEHHGTGLVYYFYQKAITEAQQDEKIDEADYRYPGPKPQRKETAVVMLADSVEGAVRALEEPTPGRIEEVVRKVINNKFIDGQLDESGLTLKDIETICAAFIRVLCAMYHSRIKYPEKRKDNGHHHHKSAEKDSSSSPPDHPAHS